MSRTLLVLLSVFTSGIVALAEDPPLIDSIDLDSLRSKVGTEAIVQGHVVTVGTTPENTMTFLNIGLPARQGFVAIIHQKNYDQFPDGFSHLRGKTLRIRGLLDLYAGSQPQIVISDPTQIEIVEE